MSTPDPTPTPLPAAPDWRALCQELRDALENVFKVMAGEAGTNHISTATNLLLRADVALDTPPAPSLEPRGCPTPGACSCPTAPIVPPELIRALQVAEAALADIGDADREPGDDIAWADRRAAQDLPRIRHALRTWRDHATPPAATRKAEHDDGDDAIDRWVDSKSDWIANWGAPRSDIAALIGEALEHWGRSATRGAGPLPQAGLTDEQLLKLAAAAIDGYDSIAPGEFEPKTASAVEAYGSELIAFARAVLARWGGAAVPSKVAPTEEDLYDLAEAFNGDPVPAIRRALELWGGAAVPVPVSDGWPEFSDCDDSERVHCFNPVLGHWKLSKINPSIHTHWLPHWALPVPAAAAGEVE